MTLHSKTHDLTDRLFWHTIRLNPRSKLYHRFPSHETQYPYRVSNSRIFRWPGSTLGLVIGNWEDTDRTEDEAILAGLSGREVDVEMLDTKPNTGKVSMESMLSALSDHTNRFFPGSTNVQ